LPTPSQQKRAAHKYKFKAVRDELAQRYGYVPEVSIKDVCWMARNDELLRARPIELDDPELSSHLYGPAMRVTQNERIEVIELDEDGRVMWRA
jgi:hypothetical protein